MSSFSCMSTIFISVLLLVQSGHGSRVHITQSRSQSSSDVNQSSGKKSYHPIFFMHGIGNNGASGNNLGKAIQRLHPNTVYTTINLYEDQPKSLNDLGSWTNMDSQMAGIRAFIMNTIASQPSIYANGYHLICHSQGGLICRGLISKYGELNIKTFVSLAGPQMGVDSYEAYAKKVPDFIYKFISASGFYSSLLQEELSVAGYWKDRTNYDNYQKESRFLAVINNEAPETRCSFKLFGGCFPREPSPGCTLDGLGCVWAKSVRFNQNRQMKSNFEKLDKAVFLGSPQDEAIVPWQSQLWGYYADGSNVLDPEPKIVPFNQTVVGRNKLVPLEEMIAAGKAFLISRDSMRHNDWLQPSSVRNYIDFLT